MRDVSWFIAWDGVLRQLGRVEGSLVEMSDFRLTRFFALFDSSR
jgi:hypothetical protein